MKYEIKIPTVGESITEATIGAWMKKSGEAVSRNDILLSIDTDKASVEVVAEQDGVLTIVAEAGKTVPIGSVVGSIDGDGKAAAAPLPAKDSKPAVAPQPAAGASASLGTAIHPDLRNHQSPAVAKIVTERGLDASTIPGTGRDGRLTKGDVLSAPAKSAPAPAPIAAKGPSKQGDQKRVPMTTIRKRIAERLVQSQQTTATLTTFNEVDMTRVMDLRAKYKDKFKERYGVGLGFMGFFVKASIEALKAYPAVNAFIEGTELVYNNYYNVGMAVGTEKGLIVPVVKDADNLSIAGVEAAIRDYAVKAREGKIAIDDLNGGTFTITNGGVYGSLMSTPILNPPQSGILGLHKIEERAVVINGKVEVRPMMYLALSYDHRVIDGKEAVSFLVKVKEGIEDPERLLLEI
ncbi:MAG: 2-oxoglutarate dehydrogenase complex dihydrolipoyllysine-residue succinyltransferase [Bdellovibrio sp.]